MFSKKAGMSYFFIKIKPSHTIVSHNVISQFVSYGGSPTAINATLAIIANGGRAIVVNWQRGSRDKLFSPLVYWFYLKSFDGGLGQPLPQRFPGVGYARPTKPCRRRGKWLHPGGEVCVLGLLLTKSLPSGIFLFPPEPIGVKLLRVSLMLEDPGYTGWVWRIWGKAWNSNMSSRILKMSDHCRHSIQRPHHPQVPSHWVWMRILYVLITPTGLFLM